jgi:hypothetical protein
MCVLILFDVILVRFSRKLSFFSKDLRKKYGRAFQATDGSIIRRMRFARWTTKATDTHPECVILIAFPRQQWLRERASLLCCTYIASRVICFSLIITVCVFAYEYFILLRRVTSPSAKPPFLEDQFKELEISGIQDVRSKHKQNLISHLERMDKWTSLVKIRPLGIEFFHVYGETDNWQAGRQTDRHDAPNTRFSQFSERS